jgi:hypothetical protein
MMQKFPHVEDYLEIINGNRDSVTGKLFSIFERIDPIVSLARYDVKVINSMATASAIGNALTDKQAELACKLVLKYQRQLANLGIDVSPVENPKYRIPLRTIDRRRLALIQNDKIVLQFSFEPKIVDAVRNMSKASFGSWKFFNEENKQWRIALTEPNLMAVLAIARKYEFEIDSKIFQLEKKVLSTDPLPIELDIVDEELTIRNAPNSLADYVKNKAGDITLDNLVKIIDLAGVCHFGVTKQVEDLFVEKFNSLRLYNLLKGNHIKYSPDADKEVFDALFVLANITNRLPIYVYEPDLSDRLRDKFVLSYFNEEDVLFAPRNNEPIDTTGKKVVYFTKYRSHWLQDIPLLVTSAGMMHGAEKTLLLQRAEKVVFFAAEVYNTYKGK